MKTDVPCSTHVLTLSECGKSHITRLAQSLVTKFLICVTRIVNSDKAKVLTMSGHHWHGRRHMTRVQLKKTGTDLAEKKKNIKNEENGVYV